MRTSGHITEVTEVIHVLHKSTSKVGRNGQKMSFQLSGCNNELSITEVVSI